MGNVHVFNQRFPALASSLFSSLSLAFLWIAGTTCSFLEVNASEGRFIENTNESFQAGVTSASFGLICESDYFDDDGDTMWLVSKVFLSLSLALGSFTTALAWILTYATPPADRTWKALSVMSALTAVLTVPIFLIFESEPCTIDMTRQKCSLSFGSYILIAGSLSAIAVTILTQCIDPPQWGIELDAWKVCKRNTEESEHLSRDNVPSDEYAVDPEDPTPADAPVATTLGVLDLVQCWNERRKWARSSDLEHGKTFGTSGDAADDEANTPFAGAGSYYANSNNSRLVLKVTPDGKLPNDERKSNASFGDLDDYIKMLEDEQDLGSAIGSEISTNSLDDFMENASVPEIASQREGHVLFLLPIDAIANNNDDDEPEKFSDEPQYYSELKPPSSTNSHKSLLENQDNESSEEEDYGPTNRLSIGIRSLTNRVRDSSRLVKNSGKKYAMMDDDDEESYTDSIQGARDSAKDDESNRAATPTPDSDHLHHQKLMFDWNALHAAANSGILLGQEPRSDSSDEDDPEQPYFTPNETSGDDTSNSSLGHIPEGEDDDDDSTYSGSSLSDASDDVESDVGFIGEGVVPSPRKEKVRRGRKSNRERSSGRSVSSYTSLLDMTIDEETDMDLKEFLSSGEESMDKQRSKGYKSAPETLGGGDRGMAPYEFIQSETLPADAERGYIVSRTKVFDSSRESSLDSITQDVPVTPVKVDYRSTDEETNLHSRRCRSVSIPRRKKKSTIHPLVTSPKSSLFPNPSSEDTPPKKTTPWREERLYKGGIHNPAVHIVSDEENSDDQYMSSESARSAKSSTSRRARKARIRRLQRELEDSTANRKRSRTLDPPKRRRQTKVASSHDLNTALSKTVFRYDLPERDNPTLNRLLFGRDYTPDEASL